MLTSSKETFSVTSRLICAQYLGQMAHSRWHTKLCTTTRPGFSCEPLFPSLYRDSGTSQVLSEHLARGRLGRLVILYNPLEAIVFEIIFFQKKKSSMSVLAWNKWTFLGKKKAFAVLFWVFPCGPQRLTASIVQQTSPPCPGSHPITKNITVWRAELERAGELTPAKKRATAPLPQETAKAERKLLQVSVPGAPMFMRIPRI